MYNLTADQLACLERMADKSAKNIINALDASKHTSFHRFVYALGIRNVGEHVANVLEKAFAGNMKNFMKTNAEDLEAIDEVGPIVAKTILKFWTDENNVQIINNCFKLGVTLEQAEDKTAQIFIGQTFVFTGSLEKFTRQEAKEIVESRGGRAAGSVSAKTDYVVAGPGTGSKLKKAQELDIVVLTESEFLDMVK